MLALTVAATLAACGQTSSTPSSTNASAAPSSSKLQALTDAGSITGIGIVGSISARREVTQNTNTDYKWALTKTADSILFGTDTAGFTVTATLKKTVGSPTTTGTKTVVQNLASDTLQVCNLTTKILDVTNVDATVFGFDGTGVKLSQSIDLSSLFAVPFTLNPVNTSGSCKSVSYNLDTSNLDGSVPKLSAADKTFLDTAVKFQLSVNATGTLQGGGTAVGQGATEKVTPTPTTANTTSETGDKTVKLTDPVFGYSKDITQTTTEVFTRKFTCQDKTGLVLVPGTTDQYTFANTAYLTGTHTVLMASAIAKITMKCIPGCTYTQGYFKNHAQYRDQGGSLVLNKQYDQKAWTGAFDWTGPTKLTIGSTAYTQKQIFDIYQMPVAGNFAIALFHQYATVLLNSMKATNPADISSLSAEIAAAEAFFKANPTFLSGSFSGSATLST